MGGVFGRPRSCPGGEGENRAQMPRVPEHLVDEGLAKEGRDSGSFLQTQLALATPLRRPRNLDRPWGQRARGRDGLAKIATCKVRGAVFRHLHPTVAASPPGRYRRMIEGIDPDGGRIFLARSPGPAKSSPA